MDQSENQSNQFVLRNDSEGIANLVINRPRAYNALSLQCMEAIIEELDRISNDSEVKVVILSGSGKGFCAGHDLKELKSNRDTAFYEKTFETCSRLMLSIIELQKPVIAKVHGIATAAGCQLVATCDLAVADENARFATPGVNIGLFCSTPMIALSRNVSNKHAMEMLLTGDLVSADHAFRIGLVNRVAPQDKLDEETRELASKIVSKSPLTVKIGKKAFYEQKEKDIRSAYEYASRIMVENLMAKDAEEGISAILEKRDPVWCGE